MKPERLEAFLLLPDLAALDIDRKQLDKMLRAGELQRVRYGVYARPDADPETKQHIACGCVITCEDALEYHGVWIPPHSETHSRRSRARRDDKNTKKKPKPPTGKRCRVPGPLLRGDIIVDDIGTALKHALWCVDDETVMVILESILDKQLMRRNDIQDVLAFGPTRYRRQLELCEWAQSGTETMVRLRLKKLMRNLQIRTQVTIPGVGRVDLLVGDRLIIEVDGAKYHNEDDTRDDDYVRDLTAYSLGYFPIRLNYRQVIDDWDKTATMLKAILQNKLHIGKTPLVAPINSVTPDDPDFDPTTPDTDATADPHYLAAIDAAAMGSQDTDEATRSTGRSSVNSPRQSASKH